MAYCCVGSMSVADWNKIKKMCSDMRKWVEEKLKDLDDGEIQVLKDKVNAIETALNGIHYEQQVQDRRLDGLEQTAANLEITVSEVKNMYDKGDIDG